MDHAQHLADRKLAADLEPRVELVNAQRSILERERFVDPQSGAPKQHIERSESVTVGAVTDRAHHSDDRFDRRRIGRVLLAFVSGRTASSVAGHGRG